MQIECKAMLQEEGPPPGPRRRLCPHPSVSGTGPLGREQQVRDPEDGSASPCVVHSLRLYRKGVSFQVVSGQSVVLVGPPGSVWLRVLPGAARLSPASLLASFHLKGNPSLPSARERAKGRNAQASCSLPWAKLAAWTWNPDGWAHGLKHLT